MVFAMRPWRGLVGMLERGFGMGVCTGGDDDAVEGLSCHVWFSTDSRPSKKLSPNFKVPTRVRFSIPDCLAAHQSNASRLKDRSFVSTQPSTQQ